MFTCSDFLPRVGSKCCHICLQAQGAHPDEDDRPYWADWLIFVVLLELTDGPPDEPELSATLEPSPATA